MVDVLKLTYATLEQINTMSSNDGEGPAWNKFWLSLDHETESVVSGDGSLAHSHHPTNLGSRISPDLVRSSAPGVGVGVGDSVVVPGDSASHIGIESPTHMHHHIDAPSDISFPFKFKTPSGRVHRVQVIAAHGIAALVASIAGKLGTEAHSLGGIPEIETDHDTSGRGKLSSHSGFCLGYVDEDGDTVAITTDADLVEAVVMATRGGREKVDLLVHHPDRAPTQEVPTPSAPSTPIAGVRRRKVRARRDQDSEDSDDEDEGRPRRKSLGQQQQHQAQAQEQVIAGLPNELILPGAIGFLAVVILGVFTISRMTR